MTEPINPYSLNGEGAELAGKRTSLFGHLEFEPDRPGRSALEWFDSLLERGEANIYETRAEILCAAWRLCRYHAIMRGILHPDQTLSDLSFEDSDPWIENQEATELAPLKRQRACIREMPALSLLPPDVPEDWKHGNGTRVGYDPRKDDDGFMLWLDWTEIMVTGLKPKHHEFAEAGFVPLLNPLLCRFSFPSPEQIVSYETVLMDEVLEMFIDRGQQRVIQHLRRAYGFTRPECVAACRMATGKAEFRTGKNSENDRAMMILRLDHLYAKAVDLYDYRLAHQVLKTRAVVEGLSMVEVDGEAEIKEDSIRSIITKRDRIREIPAISPKLLELAGGSVIEDLDDDS